MLSIKKISWRRIIKDLYIIGILLVFVIFFAILSPKFLAFPSLINIIRMAAPLIIVAVVATPLMISGYIDLSMGSTMAIGGVIFAILCKSGVSIPISVILSCLAGSVVGLTNGFLVVKLKIVAVIATLATASVLLGIGKLLTGDTIPYIKGGMPESFSFMGRGIIFGLPFQLYAVIVVVAIFMILQKRSVLGKYSIAIGGNQTSARLAGINVDKIVWLLYILLGVAAAFAGTIRASNMTIADATSGIGFELEVITAILLGGTSFSGGEGSIMRSVVGALIITIVSIGLNMTGVPSFYQYVVKGMVLVVAVLLDKFVKEKIY